MLKLVLLAVVSCLVSQVRCQANFGPRVLGCSLEVIVTPSLKEEIADSTKIKASSSADYETLLETEIAHIVNQHIVYTNGVFQKYEFDGGKSGDGKAAIRLFLKKLKILDYESCIYSGIDYCGPEATSSEARRLLELHSSENRSEFCLSYVFTSRSFHDGAMGLAWTANTLATSGGICEPYKLIGSPLDSETDDDSDEYSVSASFSKSPTKTETEEEEESGDQLRMSLNTGVVTFSHAGHRLPEEVTRVAFAHEIGHSFGSPHDYPTACLRSRRSGGHFLMHPAGGKAFHLSTEQFSECSLKNMSRVLNFIKQTGKECFTDVPLSTCGNGIVEGWEECDCGLDCTDPCCNPETCQLSEGASCSPSEGPCCLAGSCSFRNDTEVCLEEGECHGAGRCEGNQAVCPGRFARNNGKKCGEGSKVCDTAGSCSLSICNKYNLEECSPLPSSDQQCEIHCQAKNRPETCKPSSALQSLFSAGTKEGETVSLRRPDRALCVMTDTGTAGFCAPQGGCSAYSQYTAGTDAGSAGWIVGVAIFLVMYALFTMLGIWIYCRYCKGKHGKQQQAIVKYSSSSGGEI